MLTKEQEQILRHMLGADNRYRKDQWGFRNHFYAGSGTPDAKILEEMVPLGLIKAGKTCGECTYFHATKAGAEAIGFKPYQLRKAALAN